MYMYVSWVRLTNGAVRAQVNMTKQNILKKIVAVMAFALLKVVYILERKQIINLQYM